MQRLLITPLGGAGLPDWSFPSLSVVTSVNEPEALAHLARGDFDAIVVVAHGDGSGAAAVCERVEQSLGNEAVALLLASDGRDTRLARSLELLSFDAFLDLSWDPRLVEQCVRLAIGHVRSGRGVTAIQQQILGAVRNELATLKDLTLRDEITGLYNVRHFRDVLAHEHERCKRHGHGYAIACFDLDHLRELNNTLGHATGTAALAHVGLGFARITRGSDFAFRVGGDEFAVLLVEADRDAALLYAERLRAWLVRTPLLDADRSLTVSVSAGVAAFPEDGETVEDVLARADAALYRAKSLGRSRVASLDRMERTGGNNR